MIKNMGAADRIIRVLIAALFAALYFTGTVTGVLGIILLVIGGIFLLTSIFGFCPIYRIFGIKTKKQESQA